MEDEFSLIIEKAWPWKNILLKSQACTLWKKKILKEYIKLYKQVENILNISYKGLISKHRKVTKHQKNLKKKYNNQNI